MRLSVVKTAEPFGTATYVCLVEFVARSTPYKARLTADDFDHAKRMAKALLDLNDSAHAAHLYEDERLVASYRRPERALSKQHPPL